MTEYTDKMCLLSFLVLTGVLFRRVGAAPSLNNCGGSSDDRFAEVIQGSTNNTLTCSLGPQDTGQLEWRVQWFPIDGGQQREDGAGQCPSSSSNTDTCTNKSLRPAFIPTRTSDSHSVMTVNPTQLNNTRLVSSGTLFCKVNSMEDRCTMDYITPASGTCSTEIVTSPSPWKPSINCTITQGHSSRGRYQCQGSYRKQGTSKDSWTSTWVNMSSNSLPQGQASCSLPSPSLLPPDDGRYSFRVKLRPGRQFVDAGTVELRRPTTPRISCSPTPVPENNNVSCTCTANVGQPAGSLRWLNGSKNNFITKSPLLTGDSPLVLTRQLTRGDHDVTQFRCAVLWSIEVKSSDTYTADVGFPPSSVELKINSSQTNQDMVVQEHDDVTFTCSATGGNPAADVTLFGPRLQSTPVTSQLPHVVPDVQCGDNGLYRCKASNKFGPEQNASATLNVNCKPRRHDESIGEINFIDEATKVPFDVIAYPLLANQVVFSFLGPDGNVPPSAVDSSIISLGGQCVQKGQSLFTSTCTVRVNNVTTDTAAGVYQVTVTNTVGVANFTLTVKYRAPLSSSQQDNTVAIIVGVIAVVVIGVVVAAVLIFIRRRNGKKSNGLVRTGSNGETEDINDMSHINRSSSLNFPPPAERPLSDQPYVPGDVYAVVNKPKQETQPQATNGDSPSDEYAVVVKTPKGKKATSKSKPKNVTSKSKPKKGKSDAPIYGNVPTKANAKAKKASQTPQKEEDTSRNVNQDGLIYVDVDLPAAKSSSKAPPKSVDSDQGVEYSTVDFQRTK